MKRKPVQLECNMDSINPEIVLLHSAYLSSMGMDEADMPMCNSFERLYMQASRNGVTPDSIKLVIKSRLKYNMGQRDTHYHKPVTLRKLFGDEDDIASFINEAAVIRSQMRVRVVPHEKAAVLRMTGRSAEATTNEPRHVGDVELIENLRKAANS